MSKIVKPWLGQKVSAHDRLIRWNQYSSEEKLREDVWIRKGDTPLSKPHPVEGIYVGSRTKQNGYVMYDSDYGSEWHRTGHVEVWLVVVSDRKNPIFILPQDCDFIRPAL